jgi:putative MATE family efflux protein
MLPMEKNLTEGSIFKNIWIFALPYFLSYFLQTLYGMADLFIAGQFNSADVISAVAIGSQVMHMFTVIIVGLAMGGTVLIGQAVGAKDGRKASKVTGNTITIFAFVAVFTTLLLLVLCPQIVNVMATPEESVNETLDYLRICFTGIPFIIAYNVIASIFRGIGDSKSPMIFVAISCVLNIGLDYLFIGAFGMKAAGAAFATIISQAISVVISILAVIKLNTGIKISKSDLSLEKSTAGGILKIGVPVAAQDGFIQISFLIITIIANNRGLKISAAVGIVEKIISFLFLVPSSLLSTVSAISAQNLGAGKIDRADKTLFAGLAIGCGYGILIAVLFQFIASPFLSLFTHDSEVIEFGSQYIKSYVFDTLFAGLHFCFSGYFCALGKSFISFVHNFFSIVLVRIPGAYIASKFWPETLYPMGFAPALGSLLSVLICAVAFFVLHAHLKNHQKQKTAQDI